MKETPRSLQMVTRKRSGRKAATRMLILLFFAGLALGFVPWQQTIAGSGEIFVFGAMDRPQPIEAQIPGRIVAWNVQEGQTVRRGQAIARLEDLDSKFLDAGQVKRMREQRTFAVETQEDSRQRVTELLAQKADLSEARRNALLAGVQAILQAEQRQRASGQAVRAAETALVATRKVALLSADERKSQATDRIAQAEQAVRAAEGQEATMRAIRDRAQRLFDKGLRAKQDLEIAENNLVKAETDTEARRSSLEIAKRDLTVGGLARDGAELDIVRAEAALETARANFAVAERDVTNARLGLSRLRAETAAALARVGADIQSARESQGKNAGDVRKVENELGNLQARVVQQTVRAPADGRVVRLMKVGTGATVKAGDVLAVVAPETKDRAVELFLSDNDIPFVEVGRPVRLQFAGWPALQVGGVQGAAIGTFGGKIAFIDPIDDGTKRFRVVVTEQRHRLPGGREDVPWPSPSRLRPGAEVYGWVVLDTVPLGFELWRRFNGFPPRTPDSSSKDRSLGPIKVKSKP